MTLALRVMVHPTELGSQHTLSIVLLAEDGEQMAKIDGSFTQEAPDLLPGEESALSMVINLANVALPTDQAYSFEILINHTHQASVPFRAVVIPPAQGKEAGQ